MSDTLKTTGFPGWNQVLIFSVQSREVGCIDSAKSSLGYNNASTKSHVRKRWKHLLCVTLSVRRLYRIQVYRYLICI